MSSAGNMEFLSHETVIYIFCEFHGFSCKNSLIISLLKLKREGVKMN